MAKYEAENYRGRRRTRRENATQCNQINGDSRVNREIYRKTKKNKEDSQRINGETMKKVVTNFCNKLSS